MGWDFQDVLVVLLLSVRFIWLLSGIVGVYLAVGHVIVTRRELGFLRWSNIDGSLLLQADGNWKRERDRLTTQTIGLAAAIWTATFPIPTREMAMILGVVIGAIFIYLQVNAVWGSNRDRTIRNKVREWGRDPMTNKEKD